MRHRGRKWNRTIDTKIFSLLLYLLSYPTKAPALGFEPRLKVLETLVLPLHQTGMYRAQPLLAGCPPWSSLCPISLRGGMRWEDLYARPCPQLFSVFRVSSHFHSWSLPGVSSSQFDTDRTNPCALGV